MKKPTKTTKKEELWAIVGECGLYYGIFATRKSAIERHTEILSDTWKACQLRGDKVVKVVITYSLDK